MVTASWSRLRCGSARLRDCAASTSASGSSGSNRAARAKASRACSGLPCAASARPSNCQPSAACGLRCSSSCRRAMAASIVAGAWVACGCSACGVPTSRYSARLHTPSATSSPPAARGARRHNGHSAPPSTSRPSNTAATTKLAITIPVRHRRPAARVRCAGAPPATPPARRLPAAGAGQTTAARCCVAPADGRARTRRSAPPGSS